MSNLIDFEKRKELKSDPFIRQLLKERGIKIEDITCLDCLDDMYPYYGNAPHIHEYTNELGSILTTKFSESQKYPDNFEPDPEQIGSEKGVWQGTWYCSNKDCQYSKDNYNKGNDK